jgi:hypothetical protein
MMTDPEQLKARLPRPEVIWLRPSMSSATGWILESKQSPPRGPVARRCERIACN